MTNRASSFEALVIGSAFITDLGMLFPVQMELRGNELKFTLMMSESQLGHRTTGPYTSERPPIEAVQWVQLRSDIGMAGRFPRFRIDASGQWARILVELEGTTVRAVIVMPEEVTAESLHATHLGQWQGQIPGQLYRVLYDIAMLLSQCRHAAGGDEPLIDLKLIYRADPHYEKRLTEAPPIVKEFLAPVRPVLTMRWRAATTEQRKAFLAELDRVTPTGRWPRRRLTAQIGDFEVELPG
jgi:hypothetical protein